MRTRCTDHRAPQALAATLAADRRRLLAATCHRLALPARARLPPAVESQFEKELRRRGLDSASIGDEADTAAATTPRTPLEQQQGGQQQQRRPRPPPSFARDNSDEVPPQLERSRALNSEGLEVGGARRWAAAVGGLGGGVLRRHVSPLSSRPSAMLQCKPPCGSFPPQGLPARAAELLKLGLTFFLAFAPFILVVALAFGGIYFGACVCFAASGARDLRVALASSRAACAALCTVSRQTCCCLYSQAAAGGAPAGPPAWCRRAAPVPSLPCRSLWRRLCARRQPLVRPAAIHRPRHAAGRAHGRPNDPAGPPVKELQPDGALQRVASAPPGCDRAAAAAGRLACPCACPLSSPVLSS